MFTENVNKIILFFVFTNFRKNKMFRYIKQLLDCLCLSYAVPRKKFFHAMALLVYGRPVFRVI